MEISDSRRGGILFGLALAAVLGFCLLASAGLYFVHELKVRDGVSIDTPGGRIDIHAHDRLDTSFMGIPIYPGAKPRNKRGGAVVEWNSIDGKADKGFAVVEVITSDPMERVVEYYRTRLPDWTVIQKDGAVEMETRERDNKRIVAIRGKSDGTHIGVASVSEPASN